MVSDIWGYQPTTGHTAGTDLTGYKVEATDGSIGKVDKHSDEVGSAHIVVDTGVWIFGKHVLLPAGTVKSIDPQEKKIHVALTKDQIKDSPEFDKDKHTGDAGYHQQVGDYYGNPRI
ncbi:PRC-barrel domain containing protein [Streptomyces sp. NPDC087440]|uniref:PRC-barrel domain containing protein n=1 Tax=Streptomyces sp. NPDC087440 TaxID=3365790 RepID=UPI00380A645A